MTFKLSIVNPEKVLWSGEAESLIAPGEEGELTVLSNHEALITPLVKGVLKLKSVQGNKEISIEGGMLEVSHNQATVLL